MRIEEVQFMLALCFTWGRLPNAHKGRVFGALHMILFLWRKWDNTSPTER